MTVSPQYEEGLVCRVVVARRRDVPPHIGERFMCCLLQASKGCDERAELWKSFIAATRWGKRGYHLCSAPSERLAPNSGGNAGNGIQNRLLRKCDRMVVTKDYQGSPEVWCERPCHGRDLGTIARDERHNKVSEFQSARFQVLSPRRIQQITYWLASQLQ